MKNSLRYAILIVVAIVFCAVTHAIVIKYKLADGTRHAITSSELSAIDFNDNGTITLTTWDGSVVETTSDEFETLEIGTQEVLLENYTDTTLNFTYEGLSLGSRDVRQFNFLYPTVDPQGDSITMSGCIVVPHNILNGSDKSEGVILFNHYTIFNKLEAPTMGYSTLEAMFLGNPLNPNYIIIESDFYGFGSTLRFSQAYLQGTANAHASLDCYLAGMRLLDQMGIEPGELTFNVGYSSGGFDALSTHKLRDMEFSDKVHFDKTFAGGSPSDIAECYRQYIEIDSTAYNAVLALLMLSTNDTQNLGLEYSDVFQPYVADKIDEWINSKNYSSWPVCDSIGREKKVHEILTPPYCDLNSPESLVIQEIFERNSIAYGWEPDPNQRLYIFHARDDDYVPVQSARTILRYLEGKGFTPSIVPGKTNLQTNFVVPKLGHLTGTVVYLVQTVAAIKAWPLMYENGQLKDEYAAIINMDNDLIGALQILENAGIDVRGIINQAVSLIGGGATPAEIINALLAQLQQLGFDEQTLQEMFQDSGIDINRVIEDLIAYLQGPNPEQGGKSPNTLATRSNKLMNDLAARRTPAQTYEQQLRIWLDENTNK